MFTRIVTVTGAKDIDNGIEFIRDVVTPVMRSQKGWRGTTASANREEGVFAVLSIWETDADRDASESALLKLREDGRNQLGGTAVSVDYYEELTAELTKIPTIGSKLLLTKVTMDPAKIDEIASAFTSIVLPVVKEAPGFMALRHMVNRETGDGLLGTTWADAASRDKARAMAEERQRSGVPVTIVERSERDIVFMDLPH
jgi:hypothetical protein